MSGSRKCRAGARLDPCLGQASLPSAVSQFLGGRRQLALGPASPPQVNQREDLSSVRIAWVGRWTDGSGKGLAAADGVALANAAIQAIGCLGMRACHTNNCPVGIATQREDLRARLIVEQSARQLKNFFGATVDLMKILARACGHSHLRQFSRDDLTTWKRDVAYLTGIAYAGVVPL